MQAGRLVAILVGMTGCVTAPGDDQGTDVQAINGAWSPASQFQIDRAAALATPVAGGKFNICTATRIAPNFALTAMHCGATTGTSVTFYTSSTAQNPALTATVDAVIRRPGTSVSACQATDGTLSTTGCEDSSGVFSDLVILKLRNVVTATGPDSLDNAPATMAWRYPGAGVAGQKVGSGNHDNNMNTARSLRQVDDTTNNGDDNSGRFYSSHILVDGGDSGGPFYVNSRMLGTLYGRAPGLAANTLHTSVPKHLDWILSNIGYAWVGTPPQSGVAYDGSPIESFVATERVCQYACEHTQSCQAYNYLTTNSSCGLWTGVTHTFPNANTHSALHYGQASAKSGTVVGYVRSDGVNAMVHYASDGLFHEFVPGMGNWTVAQLPNSLTPALPAPSRGARLSAYHRADGVNAIVYRSGTRVIEVALTDVWHWADLTSWGGQAPVGDPVGYVRADGVSAVVFRSLDGHINELRLIPQGWQPLDLTAASGVPAMASSDPAAYPRNDGLTSVVFRSGTNIFELFKAAGHQWDWGEPSAVTVDGAPPLATNKPYGYTHHEGTNAIVYVSDVGDITELYLAADGWRWGWLGGAKAVGNPTANVRSDSLEQVLYRSGEGHIRELTNNPWQGWDLTGSATGSSATAVTDPVAYMRADGWNAVVYDITGNHVGELSWHINTTNTPWANADVTANIGETP